MTRQEVYKVIDLIAAILIENPSIVPGQDGVTTANWLRSLFFDEKSGTLYFGRDEISRKELELILLLRQRNISPMDFIKMLQQEHQLAWLSTK
jgi:hypothetical protein